MSVRRARIQSGPGSPLLVSVAGVDVNNAEFDDVIFDGNQNPLRRFQVGVVNVGALESDNLAPAKWTAVALGKTFPAGKFPVFCLHGLQYAYLPNSPEQPPNVEGPAPPQTGGTQTNAGFGKCGGGVSQSTFYPLTFMRLINNLWAGYCQINYIIFNNIF